VAGLLGLAVGIEREWSGHATGPAARFAGTRTFLLLGLLGGIAGLLVGQGFAAVGATLIGGGGALAVVAYAVASRAGGPEPVDGTTEAAALAVLAVAALAGLGARPLAAGLGAVMVLALREKSAIQAFVMRLDEVEFRAGVQFAVLALVLLPLLPKGPYGPLGGIRPRELWLVVVLVSGLNFAGFLARRAAGPAAGAALAGGLGGLVSSTAVALASARHSREEPSLGHPLALGVVSACTVLLPRIALLTLLLQPALTPALAPYLLPPFVVGLVLIFVSLHKVAELPPRAAEPDGQNPLRLGSAIVLALGFQAALLVMAAVRERFGGTGVLASSALLGLTDMDALTLAMSRLAALPETLHLAAQALAVGVIANTILKLSVVVTVGRGGFRGRAAWGLLLLLAASLLGLSIA
jgi:uncharacterized membrane protein (DUF4010 family)